MTFVASFPSFFLGSLLLAACSPHDGDSKSLASQGGAASSAQGGAAQGGMASTAQGGTAQGGTTSTAQGGSSPRAGFGGAEPGAAAGRAGVSDGGSASTALTWKVVADTQDADVYAGEPAAASRGADAAVAYIETRVTGATSTSRVVMQRFDADGARIGALVVVADDPNRNSSITLASDGEQYAGCWNVGAELHCSRVDAGGRVQPGPLVLSGQYATLIATTTGWALAYSGSDDRLRLQLLTPTLEPKGDAFAPQLVAASKSRDLGPIFVATPSGFALVGSSTDESEAQLLRLGADLQPAGPGIPLGRKVWFAAQIAATEARAAISLSVPYGSYLLLLTQDRLVAEFAIAGGGKSGTSQALTLTNDGIGAAWLAPDGTVNRRFFADADEPELRLGAREASSALIGAEEQGDDAYQQLLRMGDRTVLVARTVRYGAFAASTAIRVTPLTFLARD